MKVDKTGLKWMKISTVLHASLMLFFANPNSLPEEPRCESDVDCKEEYREYGILGEICQGGKCLPGCRRDEDCWENENCQDDSCVNLCNLPNTCGTNALCEYTKHRKECYCATNEVGNPEVECLPRNPDEKGKGSLAENDPGIAHPIQCIKFINISNTNI